MKECDKPKSHISSKRRMIYISSNNGRKPVTKTVCLICLSWAQDKQLPQELQYNLHKIIYILSVLFYPITLCSFIIKFQILYFIL
jgi:hypothetical protein